MLSAGWYAVFKFFSQLGLALAAIACLIAAPRLLAQSEDALRRHFEGEQVVSRIDMPGHTKGIDLRPLAEQPIDYRRVGSDVRRYGAAIHSGDTVTVTQVKVKKKLIEFQLDGGGYRAGSDLPSIPSTHVSKSSREKRLEKEREDETDGKKKRELKEELDDLRRDREREQARLQADAAQAEVLRTSLERDGRLRSGSRFNLRYEQQVPRSELTPEAVMAALADYLEFQGGASPSRLVRRGGNPLELRKGMTPEQVSDLFGEPDERSDEEAAGLRIVRWEFRFEEALLSVHFVEGLVVKYSLTAE